MSFKEQHEKYVDELSILADKHGKAMSETAKRAIQKIMDKSNGNLRALPTMLKSMRDFVVRPIITQGKVAVGDAKSSGLSFAKEKTNAV